MKEILLKIWFVISVAISIALLVQIDKILLSSISESFNWIRFGFAQLVLGYGTYYMLLDSYKTLFRKKATV